MPFLDYKTVIDKLLRTEVEKGKICISLYFDTEEYLNSDPTPLVNSAFNNLFESEPTLHDRNGLKSDLTNQILSLLKSPNFIDKGLAIFLSILLKDNVVEDLEVVHLHRAPHDNIFVGETYDIGQLVWIDGYAFNGFITSLHADEADIYKLEKENLILIDQLNNPYIAAGSSLSVDPVNQSNDNEKIRVATSKDTPRKMNIERSRQDGLKKFYQQVEDKLIRLLLLEEDNPYLMLYLSQAYTFLGDDLMTLLKSKFPKTTLISENLNLDDEKEILEKSIETLKNHERERKINNVENARQNISLFIVGWKDVVEASRNRKIDTLFVNAGAKCEGYMESSEMIYIDPVEDCRPISDLLPWIIRNTIINGGMVEVFSEPYSGLESAIAARLRY